jgi:hypothetical protein
MTRWFVSRSPVTRRTRIRRRRPAWIPPLLALAALAPACSSGVGSFDAPVSDEVRAFRETHVECNPQMFQVPCQIGPDGKLYRYNPGETDRRR